MTNEEARNLIERNRSVFQYDPEMLEALDLAIKALRIVDIIDVTFKCDSNLLMDSDDWNDIRGDV